MLLFLPMLVRVLKVKAITLLFGFLIVHKSFINSVLGDAYLLRVILRDVVCMLQLVWEHLRWWLSVINWWTHFLYWLMSILINFTFMWLLERQLQVPMLDRLNRLHSLRLTNNTVVLAVLAHVVFDRHAAGISWQLLSRYWQNISHSTGWELMTIEQLFIFQGLNRITICWLLINVNLLAQCIHVVLLLLIVFIW